MTRRAMSERRDMAAAAVWFGWVGPMFGAQGGELVRLPAGRRNPVPG